LIKKCADPDAADPLVRDGAGHQAVLRGVPKFFSVRGGPFVGDDRLPGKEVAFISDCLGAQAFKTLFFIKVSITEHSTSLETDLKWQDQIIILLILPKATRAKSNAGLSFSCCGK
jgi:hypothetical protein